MPARILGAETIVIAVGGKATSSYSVGQLLGLLLTGGFQL